MSKTLNDVIVSLQDGPLLNVAYGSTEADYPRLVRQINEALGILYSRFVLLEREVKIRLIDDQTVYPLRAYYADTYGDGHAKFIADTETNPFTEDVIKITAAFDADGEPVILNQANDTGISVYTPTTGVVQITGFETGDEISLLYQAKHYKLDETALTANVHLPTMLYSALNAYIGYLVYSNMNGEEHVARGFAHLSKYEEICGMVENKDLANTSVVALTTKLEDRGFK